MNILHKVRKESHRCTGRENKDEPSGIVKVNLAHLHQLSKGLSPSFQCSAPSVQLHIRPSLMVHLGTHFTKTVQCVAVCTVVCILWIQLHCAVQCVKLDKTGFVLSSVGRLQLTHVHSTSLLLRSRPCMGGWKTEVDNNSD